MELLTAKEKDRPQSLFCQYIVPFIYPLIWKTCLQRDQLEYQDKLMGLLNTHVQRTVCHSLSEGRCPIAYVSLLPGTFCLSQFFLQRMFQ